MSPKMKKIVIDAVNQETPIPIWTELIAFYSARHATQEQFSYDVGTIQLTVPDMPQKDSFHTMLVQYS